MERMKGEPRTTREKDEAIGILMDTLTVHTKQRDAHGATWANGTIGGYRFCALVFPEHAEQPGFELGDSRISKLWVQRVDSHETVANFDRGWDVEPTEWDAKAVVNLLMDGLADYVFEGRSLR